MKVTATQFQNIYNETLDLLWDGLPEYLTYHSVAHTLYVLDRAAYIAEREGVSEPNLTLLKIAALYHDIGFTKSHKNHEDEGCRMARTNLKKYGLNETQIQSICGMIQATKIPQNPQNVLECILADADLEYLGTKHFKEVSERLYQERLHFNPSLTKTEWNQIQIDFLTNHQYHTSFCKRYKSHRKLKNMALLK